VSETPRERIEPVYRLTRSQEKILLFGGDIEVSGDGATQLIPGQIELHLYPSPNLVLHFAGRPRRFHLLHFFGEEDRHSFAIPAGSSLAPPPISVLPSDEGSGSWTDLPIQIGNLSGGSLTKAEHLLFHIAGTLEISPRSVPVRGGRQAQLDFELPGWKATLAPTEESSEKPGFSAVVRATPTSPGIEPQSIERLYRQLFLMLGFVAGREVGIGPVCGLDAAGHIRWAEWIDMRMRPGKTATRWCSREAAADALPLLADGLAGLSRDPQMEAVVDRGINHTFAANGDEVLDVRIPVACSGVELLAWAVLQRHCSLSKKTLEEMSAATMAIKLLTWAGITTELPDQFDALAARRRARNPAWSAPDVLFNVRNKLVHPPPSLTDAEWPSANEMIDAWKLATWYLELVLLRLLDYDGKYWSRLKKGHSGGDLESVPWAAKIC
jgi:hypothetical protein